MRPLVDWVQRLLPRDDEQGQTLVEYALLLALIAMVVIVAVVVLGGVVSGFFLDAGETINDATS